MIFRTVITKYDDEWHSLLAAVCYHNAQVISGRIEGVHHEFSIVYIWRRQNVAAPRLGLHVQEVRSTLLMGDRCVYYIITFCTFCVCACVLGHTIPFIHIILCIRAVLINAGECDDLRRRRRHCTAANPVASGPQWSCVDLILYTPV